MIDGLGHIIIKSGTTLIDIKKVILIKKELRSKGINFQSDIDNNVDFFDYPDGLILQFRCHIFKYPDGVIAKYKEIFSYNYSKVKLRFSAGDFYKDTSGNEADFYLRVKPEYWDTPDLKDILILTFESLKPIDFSASAIPEDVAIDSDGMIQIDSDGNYQLG